MMRSQIKCDDLDIKIYEKDEEVPKAFVVIGKILRDWGMPGDVACSMKIAALRQNGNAIIHFSVDQNVIGLNQSIFATKMGTDKLSKYKATGIIIRWANENERGIKRLAPSTPIPFLFW